MLAAIKEAIQRCNKTLHVQTLESLPKGQRDPLPRAHFSDPSLLPRSAQESPRGFRLYQTQ